MAGVGPISQDWEPVVIRKKAPTAAARKDEASFPLWLVQLKTFYCYVLRSYGHFTNHLLRCVANAGSNKAASSGTSLNTRKLDDETENLSRYQNPESSSVKFFRVVLILLTELKKSIMQARLDKKLTQAQLAQVINEKPQIIQEYESGKAIPNQQIISKLERALGVKLRRKK